MNLPSNSHINLVCKRTFLFLYACGLEAIFMQCFLSTEVMFLLKSVLTYLLCAREKFCCKSNIVFTDQGILLYYFIHIIFYKLLLRYILTFVVLYCIVSSLLLPNRICHVVDSCLSFVSTRWSGWKWLLYFSPQLFFHLHWCVLELDSQMQLI